MSQASVSQHAGATRGRASHHVLWMSLALLVLTLAAFAPVIRCGFVAIDDPAYVTANDHLAAGTLWERIIWAASHRSLGLYHPLGPLTFIVDYSIYGLNPAGFHVTSLIIHCFSVVIFFVLLRKMTGSNWRSWLAAAIFAVHPLRVESVAWISERKDVLAVLFALLTVWAYIRYAARPCWWRYLFLLPWLILSLLAKPLVLTLPALLLILDFWPLRRWPWQRATGARFASASVLRLLAEKLLPLAVAVVWVVALTPVSPGAATRGFDVAGYLSSPECELHASSLWRLTNVPVSYVRYLYKHIDIWHLCCFYPPVRWSITMIAGAALTAILMTAAAIRNAATRPWITAGWLWYVTALLPLIGIVSIAGYSLADRYTYLADVGLLIALVWSIPDRWSKSRALHLAVAGLLLILVCTTWRQIGFWRNSETLLRHALDIAPNNEEVQRAMGMQLLRNGHVDEATVHLREAARLSPQGTVPLTCLAGALLQQGNLPEARTVLNRALACDPNYPDTHYFMGLLLSQSGELDQAIAHYQKATQLHPRFADAYANLGLIYARLNRLDEAMDACVHALAIDPAFIGVSMNLADVLARQGDLERAIAVWRRAIEIAPNQAMQEFRIASQREPGNALLRDALGMALMRNGKPAEAVREFEEALRLAPDVPQFREHLNTANAILARPTTRKAASQ